MRTVNRWSAAAISAFAILAVTPTAAHADALPFHDANAQGSIGLCDATGTPIHSGNVSDRPFVAMAAASLPAPDEFTTANKAKATLYAFQPRQDIDPGEWSGMQLTGSSIYADSNHPMVAGTDLDASIKDFVSDYPAKWDGLVELRIYYSAPNRIPYRSSYPATVLRVSGTSWTVVQGADVPCDSRKVISNERLLLPASAFSKKPGAPGSATTGSSQAARASAGATATPATVGSATASSTSGSGSSTSAAQHDASQGVPLFAWLVAAAAVLAAASGGFLWWRRRGAA